MVSGTNWIWRSNVKASTSFKYIVASIAVLLLSTVGFAGHAFAANTSAHDMGDMSHGSSDAVSCMVQCQIGVITKEDDVFDEKKKKDDEPTPPQFPKSQQAIIEEKLATPQRYALETAPPEPPGYILYGIFRT